MVMLPVCYTRLHRRYFKATKHNLATPQRLLNGALLVKLSVHLTDTAYTPRL